jgi:glycosyltransferase involved in cell wall biosynthesis
MTGLDVAAYHHLPTGGALRVLAEWTRHTAAERITVYTPDPSVHAFAGFPGRVTVQQVDVPGPFEGLGAALGLLRSEPAARRVARAIDASDHDVVFVLPSRLTQSPGVLRHLRTPSVYYAPEAMRSAYEDPRLIYLGDGWRARLTRAGANPVEQARKLLDRRAARAAQRVVTHSAFTRDDLRRHYGIDAEVIRLGVDVDAFLPAPAVAESPPYVLSVGALHPLKGHELVVEAVGRLPAATRPRLTIVGDRGVEGPALRARAASLGVDLDLRERAPFADVVALMQQASVVACAQIREPFGLVALEAMACARPVVAVDEGGLRESVRDGETGLLVPRHAQAMADAIERLLGDVALRARFGAAGRAAVETSWRWERYASQIDRVLLGHAGQLADRPNLVPSDTTT